MEACLALAASAPTSILEKSSASSATLTTTRTAIRTRVFVDEAVPASAMDSGKARGDCTTVS
jgi:hypothetical protein